MAQLVSVWGFGFRNRKDLSELSVRVDGYYARVTDASPHPFRHGGDVLTFELPPLPAGCGLVNIDFSGGGVRSNTVQVFIK